MGVQDNYPVYMSVWLAFFYCTNLRVQLPILPTLLIFFKSYGFLMCTRVLQVIALVRQGLTSRPLPRIKFGRVGEGRVLQDYFSSHFHLYFFPFHLSIHLNLFNSFQFNLSHDMNPVCLCQNWMLYAVIYRALSRLFLLHFSCQAEIV